MLIRITAAGEARLEGAEDLKGFKAVVEGDGLPALPNGLGHYEGEGALWVQQAWLRNQASRHADAAWMEGFDAMVGYARGKGWVDAPTGAIRAHIERG